MIEEIKDLKPVKQNPNGEIEFTEVDMINFAKWFRDLNPAIIDMYDALSWWKQRHREG